jgi:hypothetical protein
VAIQSWVSNSHGTLVFGLVTTHGVYLAADSRGTDPVSDEAQKLFKCGDNAFVAIVATLVGRSAKLSLRKKPMFTGTIDLTEILHHACETYQGDGQDVVSYVASYLYYPLKRYWEFMTPPPELVKESLSGGMKFCTVPIAMRSNGSMQVSELQFPFSADGSLLPPTNTIRPPSETAIVWGQYQPVDSIDLEPLTHEATITCIDELYNAAKRTYPETVGGPIDIGIIDENGARWISRKRDLDHSFVNA